MSEVIRVVKTAAGQPIRTYKKFDGEIGADMERNDYLSALAEEFGSPLLVLTKKQMLGRIITSADAVQAKMQEATAAVAGATIVYP